MCSLFYYLLLLFFFFFFWGGVLCNSYTMVCPPVRGDNSQALAGG